MGYSQTTPLEIYDGFWATDTIQLEDLPQYNADTPGATWHYNNYRWLGNIPHPVSRLRSTFELRNTNVAGAARLRLQYLDGMTWVDIFERQTPAGEAGWIPYTVDFTVPWGFDGRLRTQLAAVFGFTANQRNFRIRGDQTYLVKT